MQENMTVNAAANYLNVWHQTLRIWADRGKIPCTRDRRGWRLFKVADLERLKRDLEAKNGNARQI
jgi:excisionase family DNA binding protein